MASLKRHLRNAGTAFRRPGLALHFAIWAVRNYLSSSGATRDVCGVRIGNFNGFSEYHSVSRGLSASELAFLRTYSFADGPIIDVGANLGLFSLVVRTRFPERRIFAFEPAPSTFSALQKNVSLNGAANIKCIPLAVSNHDGVTSFVVLEKARANSSLASGAIAHGQRIEIDCTTLDRFVEAERLTGIALLKLDVEGFERSVLAGAEHVFSAVRPAVVYFEICPTLARAAGHAPDDAAAFLEEKGYSLHRILQDGTLERAKRDDIRAIALDNWVALDTR